MKKAFRFFWAVFTAMAMFSSCQKATTSQGGDVNRNLRVISVSFASSSKTTIDGLQPMFEDGDVIKVTNGSDTPEDCTISVSDGVATFSTFLKGELTAVYPSTAAVVSGNSITGVKVATVQSGAFADANICKTMIADGSNSATFKNQTALFIVTAPEGSKQFTVKSLKPIVDGVARTGTAAPINSEGADDAAKQMITVGDGSSELSAPCYVSLVAGVNLSDLSFDSPTDATHGSLKGIPAKSITTANATVTGVAYTITDEGWHPYVELEMTVAGVNKKYKWAAMNIGATAEIGAGSNGTYFDWGGSEPAYTSFISGTFTFGSKPSSYSNTTWNASKGFSWENAQYTDGVFDESSNKNVFTKYTASKNAYAASGTADGKTVLDLSDDAANVSWGGNWRMPTYEEFTALTNLSGKGWDSTNKGYKFGTTPNQIFFPAAGFGIDTGVRNEGVKCYYWSSSLYTSSPCDAYGFYLYSGYVNIVDFDRNRGRSIRALSE